MSALWTLESQKTTDAGDLTISNSNRDNRKAMRLNGLSKYKPTVSWIEIVLMSCGFLTIWFVGKYFCCKYRGEGEQERAGASSSLTTAAHHQCCGNWSSHPTFSAIFMHSPHFYYFWGLTHFFGLKKSPTAGDVFALERWWWFYNHKILIGKKSWETAVVTRS